MATIPGILTDWPWKSLGSFKYALLAPWMAHSIYTFTEKGDFSDLGFISTLLILVRFIHNQIWISVSRYQTARGYKRIVDRTIEFDQIDRENNWDDQIIMTALLSYIVNMGIPQSNLPFWRTEGIVMIIVLHAGPVEFLYYWLHRALHHNYLFTRYHSHHHSSIVTQPISAVIHPFAETMAYMVLFSLPLFAVLFSGRLCLVAGVGYILYIDFMNNLGHCNFEIIPKSLFYIFPPLKYLMYTPSFHSLHHTRFRTNYSLFMPFYDYIYNTADSCSDKLHQLSLQKATEWPTLVHLTHFTTLNSVYQFRLGYSSLASMPHSSHLYLWILWPFTCSFLLFTWLFGHSFIGESNYIDKLKSQTWVIPRFRFQYLVKWETREINDLIEEAVLEAERQGAKVLSLGLLNQSEELNRNGELYLKRHPNLKVKIVDGSSLAAAVVLNSIPKGTNQILFRGNLTKVSKAALSVLCHSQIQIAVLCEDEYTKIEQQTQCSTNIFLDRTYDQKVWLVGDDLKEEDQMKAAKGTLFIPFSQFPPKLIRKDCFYCTTPAMLAPASLKNLDSCENWLGRREMSAWRVAGIIHALEVWNVNECGDTLFDVQLIWNAALRHGFRPLPLPI